jgi:nucleoid-associated protein YgaU
VDRLGTDFDTALTRGAVAALALAGLWAVLVVVAVALEAGSGGRVQVAESAGCPRVLRLWLLGVFVALLASAAPAQASDSGSPTGPQDLSGGSTDALASALDGLPLPDRPSAAHRTTRTRPPVVVRPGDSLWRIARAGLPREATDADVSRAVESLYAANRHRIGPDPDRLRPGQHLVFPDPTTLPEER